MCSSAPSSKRVLRRDVLTSRDESSAERHRHARRRHTSCRGLRGAVSSFCREGTRRRTRDVCRCRPALARSSVYGSSRPSRRSRVRTSQGLRTENANSVRGTRRVVTSTTILRTLTHGDERRGASPRGPSRAERERRCGMRPSSVRRQYRYPSPKSATSCTQCVLLCPEPGVPYPSRQTLSIARVSRVCRGTSTSVGLGPCPTTTSLMCMCSPFS